MKRYNEPLISIFFFVLALILIDFGFWLILSKQKECTQSEEHKQVMERLESVERACWDIWMHLQNKTELEEPSQFVVWCYSWYIMSDYCMVYFDSVVDNFIFNSKWYFNNPTVIDKDWQYRQFCNQEIPRNQFDFWNEYKKCKYPKKK